MKISPFRTMLIKVDLKSHDFHNRMVNDLRKKVGRINPLPERQDKKPEI